ncbi:MAG: hypothetical protein ABR866_05085 [Candidatus Korobacteraceae bacterium]|jgi:hypothetical protein
MIFDDDTITRLLGSIEANHLVLLCGAGLSIPSPSNLMSAVGVSRACYDKYQHTKVLPPAMRDGIDQLAGHFHGTHEFDSVFIDSLVPWDDLVGEPNAGHAAVSDLLISRAADAALSANFDPLIEQWASSKKIAMRGALDGQEAMDFTKHTSPLVKFHGCMVRGRKETLWTEAQLAEVKISQRVKACSDWMKLKLPGKDLLIIGFWTDWGYLNDVLADSLSATAFGSVTVVDPATRADLQTKAPKLWTTLTGGTATFRHLQASGADALAELRTAFSKVWLKKFYALGEPLLTAEGKPYSPIDPAMSCEELYDCRRDAEGIPYNRAARLKEPSHEAAQASYFHHLLIQAKATPDGAWYKHGGKRVRVIQGAGQGLNSVRDRYKEPPALPQADIVVCAGSLDLGAPGSLIGPGVGASIVRSTGGGGAQWMTLDQARGVMAI